MTIHYYGGLKLLTWGLSLAGAIVFVMDPTVKVAIIVSIPPTLTALITGWVNHAKSKVVEAKVDNVAQKVQIVETNTNDKLSRLLDERNAAVTLADKAVAHAEGIISEQERTKT